MILDKLSDWPDQKKTKYLLIFSLVLLIITFSIMGIFYLLSGNPGNIFISQLSFSAEYMRNYYAAMPNLQLYQIVEIVDYG